MSTITTRILKCGASGSTPTDSATMSSDLYTELIDLRFQDNCAIQAIWSSGSNISGVLDVQASVNNSDWVTINVFSKDIDTQSGSHIWDLDANAIPFFRVVYTRRIGTGTLQFYVNSKRFH